MMNAITLQWKHGRRQSHVTRYLTLLALFISALTAGTAQAQVPVLTVTGDNRDGTTAPITAYRWLIEKDVTYNIVPGQTCQPGQEAECASVNFHKSYIPVVAEGHAGDPLPDLDPTKRYHVSVLPDAGYAMGGVQLAAGQAAADIVVQAQPLPTAQIRIFVFHDNAPVNNIPDTPEEVGLAGFNILLEDAGGRYGVSGSQVKTDAFGNPLGTTYDNNGNVLSLGDGSIVTDANGIAVIRNLVPGKYGIQAVPPTVDANGNPVVWSQTSTIEGTHIVDAWVKANEPPYFAEFGPPGPHVFLGFVEDFTDAEVLSGGVTITGQVRSIHNSRPPDFTFYTGAPVPGCWVALNDLSVGVGKGVYAAPCNEDSTFSIPDVPDGNYQLAIWDKNLDYIFASHGVTVLNGQCNGGSCDLLDVPVFAWFGRIEQYVFNDENENGVWDAGEAPIPEQGTGLRWRDGTIYQQFPTDLTGAAPYDEVFPFFSWLVAEVAFDRFKATGVSVVVDAGGPIDPTDPMSFGGVLNPQPQSENGGQPSRTETGPVLTEGVQTFLGQTNILMWGKKPYAIGENGGISGIVYYAVTRAENDPALAAAEVWEPGIPRIQVALYEDNVPPGGDGVIDDVNGNGTIDIADVDNYPFGNFPGAEDYDFNGNNLFDAGDAIQLTTTDSWDDAVPTGCQGDVYLVNGIVPTDCFDGLRNFNQVRPAVFDGGYAFTTYVPGGVDSGNTEQTLGNGTYIVATGQHPVYKTVREEDRNVDFGEEYLPAPELLAPSCVGDMHQVANAFSLFPLVAPDGTPVSPYKAGLMAPLCDRKQILLSDGKNAAADFFMFTEVPVAAKVTGFILDDLSNEFDPNAPTFGEKYSPPYLPISIRDWTGREFARTYSDRWGTYNAVLPSSYTVNVPSPSGVSPNMITTCMNDPGPIPDGNGGFITDPNYNPKYSQFCYTFQYMPGVTTYLDTPVVPVAAFAGPNQQPLDCQDQDGTPVIWSVIGSLNGPYVDAPQPAVGQPFVADGTQTITITAAQDPAGVRDYGFGATPGTVSIGGIALSNVNWSAGSISGTVTAGTTTGQLQIVRGDNGVATVAGITVTVGGGAIVVGGAIQDAIDVANPGDLVLVPPGDYEELVIMHKPVRLQGAGASTTINAIKTPAEKLANWRTDVTALYNQGAFDLLPAQGDLAINAIGELDALITLEGPGIIVFGSQGVGPGSFSQNPASIDGFSITGGDGAGAIVVNGYADALEVSNNRIFGNYGIYSGGIRVGHPFLTADNVTYQDGFNDDINIHHNVIAENGAGDGAGGGISLYHGSDAYTVTENFVCGNFTQGEGGGIGHYGLSGGYAGNTVISGLIADNTIIFNESFNQGQARSGGGVFVGGAPGLALGSLTPGSGPVQIRANLIQGNHAGAGDGGGIRTALVNGEDVAASSNVNRWYPIDIVNNIIVNNIAGLAGAGISLQDTVVAHIINNTVAHNDALATAGEAFAPGSPNLSTAQPAGIVSRSHSPGLEAAIRPSRKADYGGYAKPELINNIVWRNRSFYFQVDYTQEPPVYGVNFATPLYQDLAVLGTAGSLNPQYSLLTDVTGYAATNVDGSGLVPNDLFQFAYVNTDNGQTIQQVELTTTIAAQPAFDEGGNFIQVRIGPLAPTGDYHLAPGAAAANAGDMVVAPATDIDGDARPIGAAIDIGADEAE
jgi:hypothetical protein